MTVKQTELPKIVSQAEWQAAREALLAKEKELVRARDALAAERRALPMVRVDKDYVFEGPNGEVSLLDLFDGRCQLLVYHFWFEPGEDPCEGCSLWVSNLGHLANLHARDTSLVLVSRASSAEIETVRQRRGWTVPWVCVVGSDFNDDAGYAGVAQITVFLRDGDSIFRTYVTSSGRDLEALGNHWTLLDLTPLGA
jgi:predicted dithiol-disulfide oxidoreductase (DUF899 family)